MTTGELKFLGSYPVADGEPSARPSEVEEERELAEEWLSIQRRRIAG